MHRRRFLGLVAGAAGAIAGCSARAFPNPDVGGQPTPASTCPAVVDIDRTVCPDDDAGPLGVEQSGTTVSGEGWSLVVTVENRSDDPIGTNPYAWSLFRRDGDRWRYVAPDAHIEPWLELAPGGRYAWQLTAGGDGLDDVDQRVFLDLAAGTYAFAVPFRANERVAAIATFDVTA